MSPALFGVLGGLGLFLFGMRTMTDGLRDLAGDRLHRWLGRMTRTPFSGAVTGALTTAVIQSSSATTVTAVGFVGAGLLTFEQALGVILGANIGTTMTGWVVAVLGFKIKLGTFSLLLLFAAALLMLTGRERWRQSGRALAGFALLFLGLDYLKDGLESVAGTLSIERFASGSLWGLFLMLGAGLVLTALTQSSSATVAATLAAQHSGVLDLPQALAVVIGANVGTTVTAWLATLGTSTASRRTGASHVVYNILIGLAAFALLPAYVWLIRSVNPGMTSANAVLATVGFHSAFNILGVVAVLPFTTQFAALVRRLVPDRDDSPSAVLDPRLALTPVAAVEALHAATAETARRTLACLEGSLRRPPRLAPREELDALLQSVADCRNFVERLASGTEVRNRLPILLHACDHIERLLERCHDRRRIGHLANRPRLAEEAQRVRAGCLQGMAWIADPAAAGSPCDRLREIADGLEADHGRIRREFIEEAVAGTRSPADLDRDLAAHRWLRRSAHHLARICERLEESRLAVPATPAQTETAH